MIWLILFLLFYILPLIVTGSLCFAEHNRRHDDLGILVLGAFTPIINILGMLSVFFSSDKDFKEDRDFLKGLFLKLPDFCDCFRLSENARLEIDTKKQKLKRDIQKLKEDYKRDVHKIKEKDSQKVLLDKLGLTEEDLKRLKELKNG